MKPGELTQDHINRLSWLVDTFGRFQIEKNAKITVELPKGKVNFCREKQMFAVRGTVPRNKEKRAVRKDKTDRPFLGNSIDTRPEV